MFFLRFFKRLFKGHRGYRGFGFGLWDLFLKEGLPWVCELRVIFEAFGLIKAPFGEDFDDFF